LCSPHSLSPLLSLFSHSLCVLCVLCGSPHPASLPPFVHLLRRGRSRALPCPPPSAPFPHSPLFLVFLFFCAPPTRFPPFSPLFPLSLCSLCPLWLPPSRLPPALCPPFAARTEPRPPLPFGAPGTSFHWTHGTVRRKIRAK
jgi:hypothetical protein